MLKDLNLFKLITTQLVDKIKFLRNFQLNKSYIQLHLKNQKIASTIKDLKRKIKSLNLADEKSLLNSYAAELDFCYEFLVKDRTNLEVSIARSTRKLTNIYLIHRVYKKQAPVLQAYKVLHLNIINLRRSLSIKNVAQYRLKHLTQVTNIIKIKFPSSMEAISSYESSQPVEQSNGIIEDNLDNTEVLEDSFSMHSNRADSISPQVCCQKSDSSEHSELELTIKKEQCDEKSLSNTEYIKKRLGQPLRKALAYLVVHKPSDPILILANFLLKYRFNILNDLITRDESEALMKEREHILTTPDIPECDPCSRYRQVD